MLPVLVLETILGVILAIGVAYVHPLSRRTNVYATYGQTRNNTTGNFALRGADETIAPNAVGNDPKAFSVGVRHTF